MQSQQICIYYCDNIYNINNIQDFTILTILTITTETTMLYKNNYDFTIMKAFIILTIHFFNTIYYSS